MSEEFKGNLEELAELCGYGSVLEIQANTTSETLQETIVSLYSALATINPAHAAYVLDILNKSNEQVLKTEERLKAIQEKNKKSVLEYLNLTYTKKGE